MELLEHQAKELFRMVDIPTLPAQTIKDSRQIKQLQIPYPVVLKSQVRSGGRGKAGGVRFVANTIDAIAAARTIFNLSILGEYPEVILAEAHYNTEREFFLAIVLDYDLQCPILLGSAYGGMNVDSLLANLQQVVVEADFSLFYARRLAASMGLSGQLICSVSEVVAKMYRLFDEKDLNLIEINPLGVNKQGEVMALDGKITINDCALARQPIVQNLTLSQSQKQDKNRSFQTTDSLNRPSWHWLDWYDRKGKIAIVGNSFDLALLTWDLLHQDGVKPSCGIVIDRHFGNLENNYLSYPEILNQIFRELESNAQLKVIFINIWSIEITGTEIIQIVTEYIRSSDRANFHSLEDRTSPPNLDRFAPKFVLRLPDQNDSDEIEANPKIADRLFIYSDLEMAVQKAISEA